MRIHEETHEILILMAATSSNSSSGSTTPSSSAGSSATSITGSDSSPIIRVQLPDLMSFDRHCSPTLGPLPIPLQLCICRQFLRHGKCTYPGKVESDSPSARTQSQPASSTACTMWHVAPNDVKPLLKSLVAQGLGFVTTCQDFQFRHKCQHAPQPHDVMCCFLHLHAAEEAQWLASMSPAAVAMRKAYLDTQRSLGVRRRSNQSKSGKGRGPREGMMSGTDGNAASGPSSRGISPPSDATMTTAMLPLPAPDASALATGELPTSQQPPQQEVCRRFAAGSCFLGGECRYSHAMPPFLLPTQAQHYCHLGYPPPVVLGSAYPSLDRVFPARSATPTAPQPTIAASTNQDKESTADTADAARALGNALVRMLTEDAPTESPLPEGV